MSSNKNNWLVGSHMRFRDNIADTVISSLNKNMASVQFFLGNPKCISKRAYIEEADINRVKELDPINIFTHFPYCVNLAGSISLKCLAWDDSKNEKRLLCESILLGGLKSIEYELKITSSFNKVKNGVVIHPGNWPDRKEGLKAIAASINKIKFPKGSTLLLENSAGQGNSLATTFEEIKAIIDDLNEEQKQYIGICIDTCHIFAYGDYDLRECKEVDRMLSDFDKLFGRNMLKLIHLNDSTTKLKSRRDNHAFIGEGYIWKDNITSLIHLLNETAGIPTVLETTPDDMETIEHLKME